MKNLKVIHNLAANRLKNKGHCTTCLYLTSWQEHGVWFGDCSNALYDKLPETKGKTSWGEKGCPCLLWEPINYDWCDKHGFYSKKDGCDECEIESYKEI